MDRDHKADLLTAFSRGCAALVKHSAETLADHRADSPGQDAENDHHENVPDGMREGI